MSPEEYEYLKNRIRTLVKFDLENYRSNQMMRRLDGFIARAAGTNVARYCEILSHDQQEVARLRDFLTINVSEFFRDLPYFTVLQRTILPELLKHSPRLNIWSAGCSIGAEAYSMAMILECLTPFSSHRILATDIDDDSLSKAAAGGPYRAADVKNVPEAMKKYLVGSGDSYSVIQKIRERVHVRRHDLMLDPAEFGFDLIVCRNVVIYFAEAAKKRLKLRFARSLKPGGVLFIGATETMSDAGELGFERLSPCFYRRLQAAPITAAPLAASSIRSS